MSANRQCLLCVCLVFAAMLGDAGCLPQTATNQHNPIVDLLAERLAVVESLLKLKSGALPDGKNRTSRLDNMIVEVVQEEQRRSQRQREVIEQPFERQRIDYTPHFHTAIASNERFVTGEFVQVRQYQTRSHRSPL